MQKIISLTFLFSFIGQLAFAQSNFVDASITLKDGKEMSGQMDYQQWVRNPRKVLFKSENQPTQTFLPSDIKGFVIKSNAERYLSSAVTFNIETIITGNLKKFNTVKEALAKQDLQTDTVFLLVLKTGSLNLYSFKDVSDREHFFCQKNEMPPEELGYRKVVINPGTREVIRELKEYVSLLKKYMLDCPDVFDKLENLPYREKAIMRVFDDYNNCKNNNTYTKNEDERQTGIYGIIGIDKPFTTYSVGAALGYVAVDEPMNEKISPILGLGYDIALARNRNKWGFVVELLYKKVNSSFQVQYPNQLLSSFQDDYLVNLNMNYVQLNTFIRHTFYSKTIESYVKIGPSIALITGKSNLLTTTNGFSKQVTVSEVQTTDQSFGLNGALGVKKGNLFFEGRFGVELDIAPTILVSIRSNYLSAVLGYSFPINKK